MSIINIKGLNDTDIVNYKKTSMFIIFPKCSFKCDKECGECVCQNSTLAHTPEILVSTEKLAERYIHNPLSEAIVCGGLEPMDTFDDLLDLIIALREKTEDDIVIYTGYTETECKPYLDILRNFSNIIIKFGRFIPHQEPQYDEVLGINLSSPNQYARRISYEN